MSAHIQAPNALEQGCANDAVKAGSRAKRNLMANISHEIRTPMNAIMGFTNLLRHSQLTPVQAEQLDTIYEAAAHLLSILDDVLDIAKVEAGKFDLEHIRFSPRAVLEETRKLIAEDARAKGLIVKVEHDDLPLWVRGDPTRTRQALLNYAANAVKFTEHGSIIIRCILMDEDAVDIGVRFEVIDTGIGIAPGQIGRLFQAFEQADTSTTRAYSGNGFGLAVTKRLAGLMGGQSGAQSQLGLGSTFWFTARFEREHGDALPRVVDGVADPARALREAHGSARVLLVEDSPINRDVALEFLRLAGLCPDLAMNGRLAVEKVLSKHYDLILMDVHMPVMDGLQATRAIRAMPECANIPIVAMSADAFAQGMHACEDAGMNDFIAKPVDPQTLYTKLLKWLSLEEASSA